VAPEIIANAACGVIFATASGKSTITTCTLMVPVVRIRSAIRGHPPIDTSPRPSATGSLHGATSEAGFTVAEGVGFEAATVTPLPQTNFFPDLIHVKVFPEAIDLIPTFAHVPPALAAAFTGIMGRDNESESIDKKVITLLFSFITHHFGKAQQLS
jgi:hypothetical protein